MAGEYTSGVRMTCSAILSSAARISAKETMHEQGMHKVMIVLENRITVSHVTTFPASRRSAVHRTPHDQQEPGEKEIAEWQGGNRDHPEFTSPEKEPVVEIAPHDGLNVIYPCNNLPAGDFFL